MRGKHQKSSVGAAEQQTVIYNTHRKPISVAVLFSGGEPVEGCVDFNRRSASRAHGGSCFETIEQDSRLMRRLSILSMVKFLYKVRSKRRALRCCSPVSLSLWLRLPALSVKPLPEKLRSTVAGEVYFWKPRADLSSPVMTEDLRNDMLCSVMN